MEIANLVISILSLIATIAISFVIYFLEQHNQKVSKEKEVKQEAKRFIIDNANELDYLHWANRMFQKHSGKLTYEQYLEDYLYCKFDKPDLMPKDIEIPLPNDYLISVENLRECDEDYLCYWIMIMVENVISFAIRYLQYKEDEHTETDAQVETFEDKYFSVLYELYYTKKNNDVNK